MSSKKFIGSPCKVCGGTERYKIGRACVSCARAKSLARGHKLSGLLMKERDISPMKLNGGAGKPASGLKFRLNTVKAATVAVSECIDTHTIGLTDEARNQFTRLVFMIAQEMMLGGSPEEG